MSRSLRDVTAHRYPKNAISDPTFLAACGPRPNAEYDLTIIGRVYFALDAEAAQVKIGLTGNVAARMRHLSRQRGRPVELLGTLRGGYDLERCLHQRFARYRVEAREWYSTEILPLVLDLFASERMAA